MITFDRYRAFLTGLSAQGIHSVCVDQLLARKLFSRLLVIKHDIEANLPLALRIARIEAECGHFATYYFQGDLLLRAGAADIVREIVKLGHEAAYHYDVLDACDGDFATATVEFDLLVK